jgi:hypothetical protein
MKDFHGVIQANQSSIREYMKYMICNGSWDEKREILAMIKVEILIKDKKVYIPAGEAVKPK